MAYQDIAQVTIALQSAGVSSLGFGTPLFASSHRYFPERVRAYTSLTAAAQDLPTDSNAYQAVQAYFSNTPSPSVVKIGRRDADLTITVATGSTAASLVVFATDGTNQYSVNVDVTGQVDEDAVATAIAAAIEADPDVSPLVVAASSTNTVTIDVAASTYGFWITTLSDELTESYATTETATALLAALTAEDDDFYFFSADDHTEAFVLAAAADIEARTKLYFVSVQEAAALTAYTEGAATDILGKLSDGGYFRTNGFFHQDADTEFPECTYVGYNAPFTAGSVTWTNLQVALPIGQNPTTGNPLSATEKGYLEDRNAAYVDNIGGLNVLRGGKTAAGERVDSLRGRDNLQIDMDAEYTNFLLSQQGSKVPYNSAGIGQLEGICRSVLARYVARGFINDNYSTDFPREDQVPTADKAARIYQQGTFLAELTGAIEVVKITGVLSLNL